MKNTLVDNSVDYRMVGYVKNLLSDTQCTELKIATGYWDLPGTRLIYDELKSFLERGGAFCLLFGQEPMMRSYLMETLSAPGEKFPDFYIQRDVDQLRDDYRDVVELLTRYMNLDDEENSQIKVHVYGQGEHKEFLHAKCYIFLGRGYANGIIGSSNFTQKGLEDNAELNYLETENSVVTAPNNYYSNSKSHLSWFEEKWENSEPWTGKFKTILTGETGPKDILIEPKPLTPYEVYIRMLDDAFGMDDSMDSILDSCLKPTNYTALPYQLDAVKQCYRIMKKMGGFLLADVVGLGKTVVGCLLIRYYLEHGKKNDGSINRVLIIAPPSIRQGWLDTMDELDAKSDPYFKMGQWVDVVSSGSIATFAQESDVEATEGFEGDLALDNQHDYGLIIIDESHNFRNSDTHKYHALTDFINDIRTRTGVSPYIGLVSATPQNNRPKELKNQILFFAPTPKKSQFARIPNRDLDAYFSKKEREFSALDPITQKQELIALSDDIRNKILNDIIVRRTRTDVVKYYGGGIDFPETIGPNVLKYEMSTTLAQLFYDTVEIIANDDKTKKNTIQYHRYSAISRFNDAANKKKYAGRGSLTVDKVSEQLAKIMKILLVKRLESSFNAFKESLENLSRYTQNMIDMWNDNQIFICPDLDVNGELKNAANRPAAYTELRKKIAKLNKDKKNTKNRNAEYHRSDFKAQYIDDLKNDKVVIDKLLKRWQANTEDPKLDEFRSQLPTLMASDAIRFSAFITQSRLYAKENPDEAEAIDQTIAALSEKLDSQLTFDKTKLVIFSEAISTVNKISDEATKQGYRVLTITAANRDDEKDNIRANFDANYPEDKQKDDYDIIVTTEVLAEGVNLHRANAIQNYDSPWNAARLIQRIGRVNRIGSKSKAIFVYNFYPSTQGNEQINLLENAYRKLQAFHTQFGADDKVLNPREVLSPAAFNTMVSGAASPEMPYLQELKQYKAADPDRFAEIVAFNTPLRIAANSKDMVEATAQVPETLCIIHNSADSGGFYVQVDAGNTTAKDIPMLDLLERCHCDENAPALPLPTDLADAEQKAMDCYTLMLQTRHSPARSNKNIKEALRVLVMVWANDERFDSVRPELSDARKLVDAGDKAMAEKIIKINKDIECRQTAIPYTAEEISQIIEQQMSNIRQSVVQKFGDSTIFITFNKQQQL